MMKGKLIKKIYDLQIDNNELKEIIAALEYYDDIVRTLEYVHIGDFYELLETGDSK